MSSKPGRSSDVALLSRFVRFDSPDRAGEDFRFALQMRDGAP